MAEGGPEALPALRDPRLVKRGEHGQWMLMMGGTKVMLSCWICQVKVEDRAGLKRHLLERHGSLCSRCGRWHSGKCDTKT